MSNQNTTNGISASSLETFAADLQSADILTFRPYDKALPIVELKGYRIVKCLYKVAKTGANAGKAAGENSYIRIPTAHLTEQVIADNISLLAPYVLSFLQEQENQLIKEYHKAGDKKVTEETFNLAILTAYLDKTGQSNRVTKEDITNWFKAEMYETLAVAFADKMGLSDTPTTEELAKLEHIISIYDTKFQSLAGGKTRLDVQEAENMQKALDITGAGTTTLGERFYKRLEGMKVPATPDMMGL